MSAEISLTVASLEVRQHGPAIAGIWLITKDVAFPAAGWSDFVVVVLGWWAGAILKTMRNNRVRVRIPFMDGPHAVDVAILSGMLQFTMISRDREIGRGEAVPGPFIAALISQSRTLLDACKSRNWWSQDADTLESGLADLTREIARL